MAKDVLKELLEFVDRALENFAFLYLENRAYQRPSNSVEGRRPIVLEKILEEVERGESRAVVLQEVDDWPSHVSQSHILVVPDVGFFDLVH